jgi:polar amino acid transport system substrate-binding protein
MKSLSVILILCLFSLPSYSRSLEEIKKSGHIIVGTADTKTKKPVNYMENDKKVGIDIELMNLIAKELNVTLHRKYNPTLKERITFLEDDKVDLIISSFSVTQDRLKKIDFSLPYLITGVGTIMRKEHQSKVKEFNELTTQKIAVVKDATAESLFKDNYPDLPLEVVDNKNSAMKKLFSGDVDGYANDLLFLSVVEKENPNKYYTLEGTLSADPYGIGIQKNNKDLLDFINNFLKKIKKDGRIQEIIDKHTKSKLKTQSDSKTSDKKSENKEYVIKKGDTLSKIAKDKLGDFTKWREIYELNKDIITYPNNLSAGLKIKIKPSTGTENIRSNKKTQILVNTSSSCLENKLRELGSFFDKGLIDEKMLAERRNNLLDNDNF